MLVAALDFSCLLLIKLFLFALSGYWILESAKVMFKQRAADRLRDFKKLEESGNRAKKITPGAVKINTSGPANVAKILEPPSEASGGSRDREQVIGHNLYFRKNRGHTYSLNIDGIRVHVSSPVQLTMSQVQEKGQEAAKSHAQDKRKDKSVMEKAPPKKPRTESSRRAAELSALRALSAEDLSNSLKSLCEDMRNKCELVRFVHIVMIIQTASPFCPRL